HPRPVERSFAAYRMPSFERGADGMRRILQAGLRPAVLRLYDPIDSYLLGRGKVEDSSARTQSSGLPSGFGLRSLLGVPSLLNGLIRGFESFVSCSATLIVICEGEVGQAREEQRAVEQLLGELQAESLGEAPA